MIDSTKAPEGATHYYTSTAKERDCYIKGLTQYKYFYWNAESSRWRVGGNRLVIDNCIPIDSWTIYSNTKPLSELTDEQAAELFNWFRSGGKVEGLGFSSGNWFDVDSLKAGEKLVYRAKQKSGRELFIEATLLATKPFSMDVEIVKAIAEDMFNAGFKAPEGKQC